MATASLYTVLTTFVVVSTTLWNAPATVSIVAGIIIVKKFLTLFWKNPLMRSPEIAG